MSTLPQAAEATLSSRALLLIVVTAAIFLSAALLFAVEPMFTKMVLPRLGGTPQVWSVAMVFFQAALLAGYGYAHLLTRFLPGRASILIQLALLVFACLILPLSIAAGFGRPPATGVAFWLIGLFAASIGLPFFALAAVPSGLLIAVTAHISTDVAAVPLLWVVPLALYLLTFVIVFSRRAILPHAFVVAIQPVFILGLVAVIVFEPIKTIVPLIALHVGVFFVCALVCHGELARRRPAPRHLTAFYMWMSAGGMLGGILAGLLAPYVF